MSMLEDDRLKAVLEKVAHEGEWGKEMPAAPRRPRHARGVQVDRRVLMEIDVTGKEPRMKRCTIAVDNASGSTDRRHSSLLGQAQRRLRLVFRAGLHVDNGATGNPTSTTQVGRMFDSAPNMSVQSAELQRQSRGVGELGVPAACGAAANAWARATGKQPRNFPLNEYEPDCDAGDHIQPQWQPGLGRR